MRLRTPKPANLQRWRLQNKFTVVLMNAQHKAVGFAYQQSRRLYADPDTLTESLIHPPPGSWTGQLSGSDWFDLLESRTQRNRHSVEDHNFLFGDRAVGCLSVN